MRLAGCLLAIFLALPATAQVHKWVDDQGKAHYGDRVPPGKNVRPSDLRGTVSVADGMTVVPDLFKRPAAKPQRATAPTTDRGVVWIYSTPHCGYCRRAKEHLRLKGIPFVEKDVQASAEYHEEFRALGGRGVPLTLSGSSKHAGYSEERYEQFLTTAGF